MLPCGKAPIAFRKQCTRIVSRSWNFQFKTWKRKKTPSVLLKGEKQISENDDNKTICYFACLLDPFMLFDVDKISFMCLSYSGRQQTQNANERKHWADKFISIAGVFSVAIAHKMHTISFDKKTVCCSSCEWVTKLWLLYWNFIHCLLCLYWKKSLIIYVW